MRRFGATGLSRAGLSVLLVAAALASGCHGLCRSGPVDPRLHDAPHLVSERRLIGTTVEQLEQVLGPPSAGKTFAGWDRAYYLGPDKACVDSEWLVLRFGPDGRVSDARITND